MKNTHTQIETGIIETEGGLTITVYDIMNYVKLTGSPNLNGLMEE